MKRPLKVLLVEDSPDDADLALGQLRRAGYDVRAKVVESAAGFMAALGEEPWDLVLSDYQLPSFTGIEALRLLRTARHDTPFVLISGTVGEDVAVEAMKAGANDYLLKQSLVRLGPAVERELREAENRRLKESAERALRESEQRLSAVVQTAMDAIITVDGAFRIVLFNGAAERMFLRSAADAIGQPIHALIPRLFAENRVGGPESREQVFSGLRSDGEEFPIEASIARSEIGGQTLFTVILRDISDRVRAEEDRDRLEFQLRHAQKMEAIGVLAGGIAHDFNNILGTILGNAELARYDVPDEHPARESLEAILKASERARELVRQILAFSRRSLPSQSVIRPDEETMDACRLLRATIPAGIDVETVVEPKTPRIRADPTQFHQVLINLVTNALQAVASQGGKIRIAVGPAFIQSASAERPALGRYCRLAVSDNGSGIDPKLRSRIFDPFFTTKGPGSGTGLGLSVVHGIVNTYGGFIEVDSQPGQGSSFQVYFPAVDTAETPAEPAAELPMGQGEEILILDDELLLLDALRRLLEKRNYRPVVVSRPEMAQSALEDPAHRIRLAILDYAMPGSSGLDVAASLVKCRPGLPIILVSGNPGGVSEEAARSVGIREIFTKPVRAADLLPALSRLLGTEPLKP